MINAIVKKQASKWYYSTWTFMRLCDRDEFLMTKDEFKEAIVEAYAAGKRKAKKELK